MISRITDSFHKYPANLAFCIRNETYSYTELLDYVSGIRQLIRKLPQKSTFFGLAGYDDIETYASILAIWAEGYAFVPLSPMSPKERNTSILHQVNSRFVLSSRRDQTSLVDTHKIEIVATKNKIQADGEIPTFEKVTPDTIMSMLFTSGSTGVPKGVPYTRKNIDCTMDAFFHFQYDLDENDRILQMFELTFDFSMMAYLCGLCTGAGIYTVDSKKIRYLSALKVMQSHDITFGMMVPSTVYFLKPYFSQIQLPKLKYLMFGGEPLHLDLIKQWKNCIPNSKIVNISGPCEATIMCMGYELPENLLESKVHQNVFAFGSPWKNTTVMLIDENENEVEFGEEGELCFAGDHVMNGYWKLDDKNASAFLYKEKDGQQIRFYKTGDMVFEDEDGIFHTIGRKDFQYKIQGHRVELGDIEKHALDFAKSGKAIAVVDKNKFNVLEVYLFIKDMPINKIDLDQYLKEKLPSYMLPSKIIEIDSLPLTLSGKIDRNALLNLISQ